jgi:hypothetical protein
MGTRRRLAGAAILAALLVVPALPASAAAPSAHGYWWRLQTGSGPALPKPPMVPSDGMWVSANASGQQALSAVRYRAPAGVEIRSLVLKVSASSGSGAVVLACPAGSRWSPAEAGVWSTRPDSACDVAFVKGVPSEDATSWSFDVRGLARSGTLDVVILPPPPVPGASDTFSISFDPPDSSSVVTQRLPGSPSPSSAGSADGSARPGSVSPIPRVLGSKTSPPVGPQPGSPSGSNPASSSIAAPSGLQASGDVEEPTTPRGAVIGVAAGLAIMAFAGVAGRALLRRSNGA